jgi:hypothetical protein
LSPCPGYRKISPNRKFRSLVDWNTPNLMIAAVPPDNAPYFELGSRMVFEKGSVELHFEKHACVVARPVDLAWNVGAPVKSNCVEIVP